MDKPNLKDKGDLCNIKEIFFLMMNDDDELFWGYD